MKLDYTTRVTTIAGEDQDLSQYAGKPLLIVNTASKCGFTPQFDGLEALSERRKAQGMVVLGFPCNQFGGQDPGDNEEISSFCRLNYGVTFPMHAKVDVNGAHAHPLFEQLKAGAPGVLGSKAIKWNFTKFLVGPDGTILKRWGSRTKPAQIDQQLDKLLGA